jgi:hypothetical protein
LRCSGKNIMQVALNYRRLHLTSEEFAAVGDAEDKDGGYVSSNLVLTSKDKLMGVLMRYRKTPPKSFVEIPDFLARVVEAEPAQSDAPKPDPTARGWQLMMQGVANLVVSAFPRENGWSVVDTKPCPETLDKAGPSSIRILFGTDRKGMPDSNRRVDPSPIPILFFSTSPATSCISGVPTSCLPRTMSRMLAI